MDFLTFLANKDKIECSGKTGLYCIRQNHIPPHLQAVRAGLAGKPVDSATQYKSAEGTFLSRFSSYMNYFMTTSFTIYAVLTVPRVTNLGFSERVLPPRADGDNREDNRRGGTTLIQIREAQYHQLIMKSGAQRLGLPNTIESRKRGEFFRATPETCIRAMRTIGTGELYTFHGNSVSQIKQTTLKKRDAEIIVPQQVPLRANPTRKARPDSSDADTPPETIEVVANRQTVDKIINDPAAARAAALLAQVTRKSPRLAGGDPIVVGMTAAQLNRVRNKSPAALRAAQAIQQVRRSPRLTTRTS